MKSLHIALFVLIICPGIQAQSSGQSIEDHLIRERVTIVEQKLESISERLNRMDEKIASSETKKEDHWTCIGFCGEVYINRDRKRAFNIEKIINGEGKSVELALRDLITRTCYHGIYSDSEGTSGVNVGDSCYKD